MYEGNRRLKDVVGHVRKLQKTHEDAVGRQRPESRSRLKDVGRHASERQENCKMLSHTTIQEVIGLKNIVGQCVSESSNDKKAAHSVRTNIVLK